MRSLKNTKFTSKVLQLEIPGYNLTDVHLSSLGEKYVTASMAWNVTVTPRKRKGTSRMKWGNNLEKKKNQQKKQPATGKARGQRRVYIEFPRDCDHTNHFSGQVSYVCNRAKNVVGNKPPVHFRKGLNPVFIKIIFPFTGGWTIAKNWSTNSRKNTCFSWR